MGSEGLLSPKCFGSTAASKSAGQGSTPWGGAQVCKVTALQIAMLQLWYDGLVTSTLSAFTLVMRNQTGVSCFGKVVVKTPEGLCESMSQGLLLS